MGGRGGQGGGGPPGFFPRTGGGSLPSGGAPWGHENGNGNTGPPGGGAPTFPCGGGEDKRLPNPFGKGWNERVFSGGKDHCSGGGRTVKIVKFWKGFTVGTKGEPRGGRRGRGTEGENGEGGPGAPGLGRRTLSVLLFSVEAAELRVEDSGERKGRLRGRFRAGGGGTGFSDSEVVGGRGGRKRGARARGFGGDPPHPGGGTKRPGGGVATEPVQIPGRDSWWRGPRKKNLRSPTGGGGGGAAGGPPVGGFFLPKKTGCDSPGGNREKKKKNVGAVRGAFSQTLARGGGGRGGRGRGGAGPGGGPSVLIRAFIFKGGGADFGVFK